MPFLEWPIYVIGPLALITVIGFWYAVFRILKQPVVGLYFCFFATSILLTTNLPVVREKLSLTEFVIVITWMAMILRRDLLLSGGRPLEPGQGSAILLGWAFVFWVLLSFSFNNAFYADGLIGSAVETINFLYGFLLFRTTVALVDDWDKLRNCLTAWLLGAALVSFVGVWAVQGSAPSWAYEEFTRRVSSTLRNENQVASFLLPILPFAFFVVIKYGTPFWKRFGTVLVFTGAMLTLVATGSRTSIVMLAILFVSVGMLILKEVGTRVINRGLVLLGVVGIGVATTVYVGLALQQYDGDYSLGKTPAWQRPVVLIYEYLQGEVPLDRNREAQISFVLENFIESPILGVGPKQTSERFSIGEVHNTYLGVLIELGIPGLLLFLGWLFWLLVVAQRSKSQVGDAEGRVLIWCLIVGMVLLLVYSGTMFGLRQRNIWLLAGLLAALPRVLAAARGEAENEASQQTGPQSFGQPARARASSGHANARLSSGRGA